jgi:hypothetical protein
VPVIAGAKIAPCSLSSTAPMPNPIGDKWFFAESCALDEYQWLVTSTTLC